MPDSKDNSSHPSSQGDSGSKAVDRPSEASSGSPTHGPLDAAAVLEASAELMNHLGRSGLRFLPTANPDGVAKWKEQISVVTEGPLPSPETDQNATDRVRESVASDQLTTSPNPSSPNPSSPDPRRPGQSGPDLGETASHASSSQRSSSPAQTSSAAGRSGSRPTDSRQPTTRMQPVASVTVSSEPYPGPSLPVVQRQESLDSMGQTVAGCTRCDALVRCRTQTVFGEGNPQPRFAFFGEGPGADEDRTGRPFVGRAGQLLTKMIEACHLSREEVYILNTVKCRPPNNRNPEPTEIANCRDYFQQQLALLRPEYIICLGAISAQALLQTKLPVGRLRQRFHQYHDSKVLVIYHPAYLLRNPDAKRAAWADLQFLMSDAKLTP